MTLQGFPEEALRRCRVAVLAEMELNRISEAVDGSVQIHPLTTDLDIGLVDVPLAGDGALAVMETLLQLGEKWTTQRWAVE